MTDMSRASRHKQPVWLIFITQNGLATHTLYICLSPLSPPITSLDYHRRQKGPIPLFRTSSKDQAAVNVDVRGQGASPR